MHPQRRSQYLEAIGIEEWRLRAHEAPRAATPEAPRAATPEAPRAATPEALRAATPEPPRPALPEASRPATPEAPHSATAAAGAVSGPRAAPAANVAGQWQSLRAEVLACTRCALHATRTQGVFGVGPLRCDWLVIGEAPGAEEDRRGEPFVGAAGQLLDAMLRAIGLDRRSNVYIANILKSRPPGNRDPRPEEVAACLPYLERQIALLQPRIMLAVGRIAAQNLLETDSPLGRLRGRVHHFGERGTPLVVTYHPAYLLRTPGDKRKAWEDLKFARSLYQQLSGGSPIDGNRS